jgi:hypothetical protein
MPSFIKPYQKTDIAALGATETIAITTDYNESKRLLSVEFNWTAGVAPTTAENITIIKDDPTLGSDYDGTIRILDPSTEDGGIHKWYYTPDSPLILSPAEQIVVAYANTDDLEVTAKVTMEAR